MSVDQFRDRVADRDLKSGPSIDDYCLWIGRFDEWREGSGEITEGVLRDFDTALDTGNVECPCPDDGFAYQTRVKALSAVALWARVMENTDFHSDIDDLVRGEPDRFDPTVLSRDEVERILDHGCDLPGCQAARHVGYDAIMRAEEVARVKPEDIDVDEGTIYVRSAKNSLPRTIGLSETTIGLLAEQHDRVHRKFETPTTLFYNSYWNSLTSSALSMHFLRHHSDAGFHAFGRHTAIVHYMEDHGFGDAYVRARHRRPSTTARYCSIANVDQPAWI